MCINKNISLISYIIGVSSSILLFLRGYKIEGLLYGYISQMQLIEFLLWNNNKKNYLSKFISNIGIFFTHTQPLFLYLLILIYNKKPPNDIHLIIIIFIISSILYFHKNYNLLNTYTIGIPDKKELLWKIQYGKNNKYYFIFTIILALLCIRGLKKYNYLNAFILTLGFVISYIKYYKSKGVGTMWCLYTAYAPVILNIIYTIKK